MTFKVIETQEELNAIIEERLKRERETTEKKYADYEHIKAENDSLTSQVATLTKTIEDGRTATEETATQIAELNGKIKGYETSNMRVRIALENGLPYEFASRLTGDDEKAITEDAKKLLAYVGQRQDPPLKTTEPKEAKHDKKAEYLEMLEGLKGE